MDAQQKALLVALWQAGKITYVEFLTFHVGAGLRTEVTGK
jgi:hypothetical protein